MSSTQAISDDDFCLPGRKPEPRRRGRPRQIATGCARDGSPGNFQSHCIHRHRGPSVQSSKGAVSHVATQGSRGESHCVQTTRQRTSIYRLMGPGTAPTRTENTNGQGQRNRHVETPREPEPTWYPKGLKMRRNANGDRVWIIHQGRNDQKTMTPREP